MRHGRFDQQQIVGLKSIFWDIEMHLKPQTLDEDSLHTSGL